MFLSQEYTAVALIIAKYDFFGENFITSSELVKFNRIVQQEFNDRQLDVVITFDKLIASDFKVINGVIILLDTSNYHLNINRLPSKICDILTNKGLLLNFFLELENRKLKALEDLQSKNPESDEKNKMLSLVLPKATGKGISNLQN